MDTAAGGRGVFGRIGSVVVRWPWLVIAAWIALGVGLTLSFPPLAVLAQKAPASVLPPSAPSVVGQKLMADAFTEASSENILLVVLTDERGLTKADEDVYRNVVDKLRAQTHDVAALQDFISTPPLKEILASKDRKAWLLPVNIVGEIATPKAIESTKRAIKTVQDTVAGTSLRAYTTGPAGTILDIQDIGDHDRVAIEAATVISLLTILLVVYRNVLTMLLPLITIGVSLVAAQGVVAGLGTLGLSVSNQTIVLLTAMLAGAGTDYAVFLISRYHDYLRAGDDSDAAIRNALGSVGKVITASAATVAVTFIGMIFTKLTVFYTVGVALAAAIVVGCIGALTFLPALLVLAGRRGWARPRRDLTSQFWRRSGIRIVRRPAMNLLASLVLLTILAASAGFATYNYDDRKALPATSESIRGYDAITRHFPLNASLPQYITVSSPRDLRTPQALADLEQMAYRISQVRDIDIVRGITRPAGESLQQARLAWQAGEVGNPLGQASGVITSNGGNLDLLVYGADQVATALESIRSQIGQVLARLPGLPTLPGGPATPPRGPLPGPAGPGGPVGPSGPGPMVITHGAGGSPGITNAADAIGALKQTIGPALDVLTANPACNADPECLAVRGQLQLLAEARNNGTLDRLAALDSQLPPDPASPTPTTETTPAVPPPLAAEAPLPATETPTATSATPAPTAQTPVPTAQTPVPTSATPAPGKERIVPGVDTPPTRGVSTQPTDSGSAPPAGTGDPRTYVFPFTGAQAATIQGQANAVQQQFTQLIQGLNVLADASRRVASGVKLLVEQTKRLGAGLEQASSFLLSIKANANTQSMAGFYIPAKILSGEEFRKAAAIFISPDGRTVRYLVQTKLNPFTTTAMDQTNEIIAAARSAQPNTTLSDAKISMTGLTVTLRDTRDYYYRDLRLIILTTILVVLSILIVLLRALVAPLYLILSVVVSYLSALGMGVLLFQFGLGQQLHWSVPGLTFIILVAVGADYNLLLISRIRDESPHGIRSGVIRTVTQTGGVITAAGVIFAASMVGLQFSSITTLAQIGFIIAAGILLDTFLVRTVTVPAIAVLVGKANWWPSKWQPPSPPTRVPPEPEPVPAQ